MNQPKYGLLLLFPVALMCTTACRHQVPFSPVDAINAMCPLTGEQHYAECGNFCRVLIKNVGIINHITVGGGFAAANIKENVSAQKVSDALLLSIHRSTTACNAYYHEPPKITEEEFVQILIGTDDGPGPLQAIKLVETNAKQDMGLAAQLSDKDFVFINRLLSNLAKLSEDGRKTIQLAFENDQAHKVSHWENSTQTLFRSKSEPSPSDLLKSIDQKITSLESSLDRFAAKLIPGESKHTQETPSIAVALSSDEVRRPMDSRLDAIKVELDRLAGTISSPALSGSEGTAKIDENLKILNSRINALKSDVEELTNAFSAQGTFVKEKEIQIYFGHGRSSLSPDARVALEALRKYSGEQWFFRVVGFADKIGTPELNLRLGANRANAVVAWIVGQLEVSPERIVAVSGGETNRFPKSNEHNGNRTAIVYIVKKSANVATVRQGE